MNNFKNFTEKIRCRVIPITRDRRVWLDEKIVDDDLYCVFMNDRSYELGEEYYDFLYVTVDILSSWQMLFSASCMHADFHRQVIN